MINWLPLVTSSVRAGGGHQDRRGPAGLDRPRRLPHLLAGLDVVGQQQRLLALVLVALDDHQVLEQHRRGAGAHAQQRELADVGLPLQVAVDVVAVQAFGPEVGHHHRAVGDHGRGGIAAAAVAMVEHGAVVGGALPQHGARGQVQRQHLHRVELVDADAVGVHPGLAFHHVHRRLVVGRGWPALHVGGQEDARAPDDGLRLAVARKGCLPGHIARGGPFRWQVLLVGDALSGKAAPLRPVGCRKRGGRCHNPNSSKQKSELTRHKYGSSFLELA